MKNKMLGKTLVIGTAAVLLCVSGCARSKPESTESTIVTQDPTQITLQTEPITEPTIFITDPTQLTEVIQTEPVETGGGGTATNPTQPEQTEPQPPEQTQATQPQQTEATRPPEPVTDKLSSADAQSVVSQAISRMGQYMPECKYDASWSAGTVVPIFLQPGLALSDMAERLVGQIMEMFEYESVTCNYSLRYAGIAGDGSSHTFEFTYAFEIVEVPKPDFNSQSVVSQVTQNILASGLGMQTFDGANATAMITLDDVPLFYDTQRAVQTLTDSISWKIQSSNLMETVYTQFKLVFVAEGESSYQFLLYLK